MGALAALPLVAAAMAGFVERAAATVAASTVPIEVMPEVDPALRILPLGDSLTDGFTVPGGYRTALAADLDAAGVMYDFVGSLQSGPDELADQDEEGHGGWRIDQIAAIAVDAVTTYDPDVVLLMIGTNDIVQGYDLDHPSDRLADLIDEITDANPDVILYVSTIPPLADVSDDAEVEAYNGTIPATVAAARAADRDVRFVDAGALIDADQLSDGVHPVADAYASIGHAWSAALLEAVTA